MNQTKKFDWFFAITVSTVLIILYSLNIQINSLKSSIKNVEKRIDSLITNENIVISSYDDKTKTALVEVSFDLNKYIAKKGNMEVLTILKLTDNYGIN